MLQYSKIITDRIFCPVIDKDGTCKWTLPSDFNENFGQSSLGVLQQHLDSPDVRSCFIDMQNVTWGDPVPLLCLALVLAGSNLNKNQITIHLGETEDIGTEKNRDHRIFLKFFATQEFLSTFSPYTNLTYTVFGKRQNVLTDNNQLRLQLASIPLASYLNNAECIHAKIISVGEYKNNLPGLQRKVDELLAEMKDYTDGVTLVSNPVDREALHQKVKKILFELLLNVAEHAYPGRNHCFAGVYARIRAARPPQISEAKRWCDVFEKKTLSIYGQKTFRPNHYSDWMELYICDTGIGLTDKIQQWSVPKQDLAAQQVLAKAQKAKNRFQSFMINRFQSICTHIFRSSFSHRERHDEQRTAVTGLTHLGHLLRLDQDHCRMYVYERQYPGGWIGDHHPWTNNNTYSRKEIITTLIRNKPETYGHLRPVTGTVYAFALQPGKDGSSCCNECCSLGDDGRKMVIDTLRQKTIFTGNRLTIAWFDRQIMDKCVLPDIEELVAPEYDVIVLRPPSQMNKFDIAKWLAFIVGIPHNQPRVVCRNFFLVGLSNYQLLVFYELLRHVRVSQHTELNWYLVSDQWDACCLSTRKGEQSFVISQEKARQFLQTADINFSITDLALLLRQMDSEIFWQPSPGTGVDPFFNRPVIWKENSEHEPEIVLPRYLDLPVALIDPEKYHACLRALKRCLALFPGYRPIPADDLVRSLVREAGMSIQHKQQSSTIMVGSIVVTGKTLENLSQNQSPVLHILHHCEVNYSQQVKPLVALLWKSSVSDQSASKGELPTPWRRITSTPYIAPEGERSISIFRYRRNDDGSIDFNKPYYARTPEDTYSDFERLDLLKIGHWHYGPRHDLLTINMRLAFRFSFQELGPLYLWLRKEFEHFFSNKPNAEAQILVYPSHPVTDTLFDRIRRDPGFQDEILPEGGMIPIKYVGRKTVSPLLASHLVKERIESVLKRHSWQEYKWSVVLFDDGTISGKHLRETTQLLQALKAEKVYLMVTLDRSGLPVQEEVFGKFLARHKRFWRWDVPGLGSQGKCPLCQGLAVAETYFYQTTAPTIKQRLKIWQELWQLRDIDTQWFSSDLKSTRNINPPLEITFGIVSKQDAKESKTEKPKEKRLKFISSAHATALLMELTRLTPRADVAMKKAMSLYKDSYHNAAIEIISTQLFLFTDEMTDKELQQRYAILLEWLWDEEKVSGVTALAGLLFMIIENRFIESTWSHAKELLANKLMRNSDIAIIISYLCKKRENLSGEIYFPDGSNKIEIQNFLLLERPGDLQLSIKTLLSLFISNPARPTQIYTHPTEFRRLLRDIADGDRRKEKFVRIRERINQLYKVVNDLTINFFVFDLSPEDKKQFDRFLEGDISSISSEPFNFFFGVEESFMDRVINSLFFNIKESEDFDKILDFNMFSPEKWKIIVEEKIQFYDKKSISHDEIKTWTDQRGGSTKWNGLGPIIKHSIITIQKDKWIYCDRFFREAVRDILSNVLYAINESDGMIKDPFRDSSSSIERAHLWWRIMDEEDFIVFETANATESIKIDFKNHTSFFRVELAGGKISSPKVNDGIAFTRLYLPKTSFFLGERR